MADSCSVGSVAMALALLTHDVDAAEVLDGGVDGALHVLFLAHVADHRDALAAGGLDVGHGGVHGAWQLGVRLGGLGQQHDVGALLGRAQRDRQPDAAAAAGDDEGAVGERCARWTWVSSDVRPHPRMVLAFSFYASAIIAVYRRAIGSTVRR